MKYRKKPVVIEAVKFTGADSWAELEALEQGSTCGLVFCAADDPPFLIVNTLEGNMRGDLGDYIIRGVKGELYPCKPDIFEATYDWCFEANPEAVE